MTKIISLPEEYELIGFFECEPELAVKDAPWSYNKLRFEINRGRDRVVCEIEPAFGELRLLWEQDGLCRTNLKLNELADLSVHVANNDDHMTVSGLGTKPATLLKLRLKPFVSVELACWHRSV